MHSTHSDALTLGKGTTQRLDNTTLTINNRS